MEKRTAVRLITEITLNYGYAFKDMTDEKLRLLVERWFDCLKDYTEEQVETAFKITLCSLSRPPTIADIIGHIRKQNRLTEKSDLELWTELIEAAEDIRYQKWHPSLGWICGYEAPGEKERAVYNKLSPAIRAYLDFNALCDIAGMDNEERKYERSRFLKAIPELREGLQERELIGIGTNDFKQLTGGGDGNG